MYLINSNSLKKSTFSFRNYRTVLNKTWPAIISDQSERISYSQWPRMTNLIEVSVSSHLIFRNFHLSCMFLLALR